MPDMLAVNNFVGAGIALLAALVALVSVLPPIAQIAVIVINYLRKLFGGPIKVEPITQEELTRHV